MELIRNNLCTLSVCDSTACTVNEQNERAKRLNEIGMCAMCSVCGSAQCCGGTFVWLWLRRVRERTRSIQIAQIENSFILCCSPPFVGLRLRTFVACWIHPKSSPMLWFYVFFPPMISRIFLFVLLLHIAFVVSSLCFAQAASSQRRTACAFILHIIAVHADCHKI